MNRNLATLMINSEYKIRRGESDKEFWRKDPFQIDEAKINDALEEYWNNVKKRRKEYG